MISWRHLRKTMTAMCWLMIVFAPSLCAACPNCKDALEGDSSSIQSGYALSIGLMMSTPFLIFGAWACWIFFACRKANRVAGSEPVAS